VLRAQGRYKEAIPEYETVLAINRNSVGAIAHLGQCKLFTGSIEETIPLVERAIRVSPRDGQIANWYWRIGVVHMLQSRLDEAIVWFERSPAPIWNIPYRTYSSPPPIPSKARSNTLPRNSRKPGGWPATIAI
jgi:tetratricopeptide (TPR) repeat protein